MEKNIILDGQKMLLVNKRISATIEEVYYIYFDGKEEYWVKDTQFKEMIKSGRLSLLTY